MRLWFARNRPAPRAFLESPSPLSDDLIELVEPSVRWVDAYLHTTRSPGCVGDVAAAALTRRDLLRFLDHHPRGRQVEDAHHGHAHGYTFWIRLRKPTDLEIAGSISLRIGDDENLCRYLGHIGYGVFPPLRGQRIAERATRLLLPLAVSHGLQELWVTANPDNLASRKTCERLGGELVDIVNLPNTHPLYLRGERRKCRYKINLHQKSVSL
jgi:tagatose 1,6-diphosphate aldolase